MNSGVTGIKIVAPWKHEGEHVEKQEAEWEEFIRRRFEWVN